VSETDPGKIEQTLAQPPTLSGYYADPKLKPASFFKAVIVSGKDGTVPEGNCRLTGYLKLHTEFPDDERWAKIRARILPPEVTRNTLDELLGELHIAGKNEWTPFEQAAHLFRMSEKGFEQGQLAQAYRMSKSYVVAKLRAYRLMRTYLEMAQEAGKEIKDVSQKWSWFEEFYKKCKPNKENPARVYNGQDLEEKFCKWVLNDQLPQAADVRKLFDCLEDRKAMALLDKGASIQKAHEVVAANRPELTSKLWKQIEDVTDMLSNTPISEIEALRDGDEAKIDKITHLLQSVKRVMSEAKLKQ
jgi:hypothetical protein